MPNDPMHVKSKLRPRTKPPAERREELMNAAQVLFLKHGVRPVTIDQITSSAQVAKGTFYLYFSSKEDILAALGDRFGRTLLSKIEAVIATREQDDWKGKLAIWSATAVSVYLASIRLHDILYGFRPATREGLVDNVIIDHLDELLQTGLEAGAWWIDDSRFTAVFLFSGLHAVVDHAYVREKPVNRRRLADRLKRLCFRAVGLPYD